MINIHTVEEKLRKLENHSVYEQEKLLYEWVIKRAITLGEFRTLLSTIKIRENNADNNKSTTHTDNNKI